jgi:hypothetical protein
MRRFAGVVAVVGLFGIAGTGMAAGPRQVLLTPMTMPGTEGRGSFAGIPGLGGPLPPSYTRPGTHPVIGSVRRTGLFAHPVTGRARYSGTAYDPILGRFETYRFRQ